MLAIVIILTAIVPIGAVLIVTKSGQADGICNYGQAGEDNVL